MSITAKTKKIKIDFRVFVLIFLLCIATAESKCPTSPCEALGSFMAPSGSTLTSIAKLFGYEVADSLLPVNPGIRNKDSIPAGSRVNASFSCICLNGDFTGHNFTYRVRDGDTYGSIASQVYANLTTVDWLQRTNSFPPNNIPNNSFVNVIVNCSCGDITVSKDYGYFLTYPIISGQNLSSVVNEFNLSSEDLLRKFNPSVNFSSGKGLLFIPVKDQNGSFRPLSSGKGISKGVVAGITIAALFFLALASGLFLFVIRRKKKKTSILLPSESNSRPSVSNEAFESVSVLGSSEGPPVIVDKAVEFPYEELSEATNGFSHSNIIGQGGFAIVYFAELRGEKVAIKRMDMQATKEFLAELKILTRVHHLNLVRLIGYCTKISLFLVYEFIDNGNLHERLNDPGRDSLQWANRVQIALDSARALEYIHEHTVPLYIHCDIKSANILIDRNLHGKVADFGLAKLTQIGQSTVHGSRIAGTFGYMAPEYAQYGETSAKVDVYAFGVVLYELISAKDAVVKTSQSVAMSKGLVNLFEDILNGPNAQENLREVVDPRLGDDYPIELIYKMAQLAKRCTDDRPENRPTMRQVVVQLMMLSSMTGDWNVMNVRENEVLLNLMSGR